MTGVLDVIQSGGRMWLLAVCVGLCASSGLAQPAATPAAGAATPETSLAESSPTVQGSSSATPTGRVGYVDIERVTRSVRDSGGAMDDLSEKTRKMQKDFQDKVDKGKALEQEISKNRGVEAPAETDRKRKEVRRLEEELKQMDEDYQREVKRAREIIIAPIVKQIGYAIQDEAHQRGLDLVLRGEAVFYGIPAVDITEAVIQRMEKGGIGTVTRTGATTGTRTATRSDRTSTQAANGNVRPLPAATAASAAPTINIPPGRVRVTEPARATPTARPRSTSRSSSPQ